MYLCLSGLLPERFLYLEVYMLRLTSKTLLFPYYAVLRIRHALYNKGLFKSSSFRTPVVCIGNVAVGGTGKTPHCEMLLRTLEGRCRVALLSRGYGRSTKGFRYVSAEDDYTLCGDEPLQIKRKFPNVTVAVCEQRRLGIERLEAEEAPQMILLDDALQHRKVRPAFSIALVSYNNPPYEDNLLPIGRLRDLPERLYATDAVVVTNIPLRSDLEEDSDSCPMEEYAAALEREWRSRMRLPEHIKLYFSAVKYLEPQPLFPDVCDLRYKYSASAFLFTAIADDRAIRSYVKLHYLLSGVEKFADHRDFSTSDIERINRAAEHFPTASIITTEKDAQRLLSERCSMRISESVKSRLFYLPIRVEIIHNAEGLLQSLESLLPSAPQCSPEV